MVAATARLPAGTIHPVHAALLAATVPLFLGALLSDAAYHATYEIQWSNFAAWLLAGAMVFAGPVLLWSLIDLLRARDRRGRPLVYFVLMLVVCAIGLFDCFVHARDAWAVMPDGLILSAIAAALAIAATWVGFSGLRAGVGK